jgi:hypothetical protein
MTRDTGAWGDGLDRARVSGVARRIAATKGHIGNGRDMPAAGFIIVDYPDMARLVLRDNRISSLPVPSTPSPHHT